MTKKNFIALLSSILLSQAAGIIGSIFTISAIPTWYVGLTKPSFSPPNWLFGPVWMTLYTLMGIALYLVSRKKDQDKKRQWASRFFLIHLFFNASWSILFFGLKNPFLGLLDIAFLWLMIVVLTVKFWQIEKAAGILLVPYLLWVSFASLLNFFIWRLN
jgi:tryptophan-rich sensory protein